MYNEEMIPEGLAQITKQVEDLSRECSNKDLPFGSRFTELDRRYVVDRSGLREIYPILDPQISVGDVDTPQSVADIMRAWCNPERSIIKVGSRGISGLSSASIGEKSYTARGEVAAPYFTADDPPHASMPILSFLTWLDRFPGSLGAKMDGDGIVDTSQGEVIRGALTSIRFVESEEVKIIENGGLIEISAAAGSDAKVNGRLPRFIAISHRRGSSNFRTGHLYALRIAKPKGEGIVASVVHVPTDGSHDRWVAWAMADLRSRLGESWCIVQGP